MQEEISTKPIISNKKVFIINDSDTMTKEAGNCLLKTLEEPPEYSVIILIAQTEAKLLNTIKSRCMKIVFNPIEKNKIQDTVKELKGISLDDNIIDKSMGSIGKALQMQEKIDLYKNVDSILNQLEKRDIIYLLNNSDVLYNEKENIQEILDYLIASLYKTKQMNKLNCIKYIEQTKRRINANCNYDMCIDYLLMNIHKEVNS